MVPLTLTFDSLCSHATGVFLAAVLTTAPPEGAILISYLIRPLLHSLAVLHLTCLSLYSVIIREM